MLPPSIAETLPNFSCFAYVNGQPSFQGLLKSIPQDFKVTEQIDYEFSGEGEHLWCWVEKIGQNTDWVAGMLASWAGTAKANVGFAGQKDRQAVTQQWFSIQLPGKPNPNPEDLKVDGVKILKMVRHNRKLQRGGLAGNTFELLIRDIKPLTSPTETGFDNVENSKQQLEKRLQKVLEQGVPNYFGEQRFGNNANNLREGEKLLASDSRHASKKRGKNYRGRSRGNHNQQSLYISALRSWMFNDLLSQRVQQQNWNKVLPGDILQLTGSDKWFAADGTEVLADLQQRVTEGYLSPTGGLFGDGELPTKADALALESQIVQSYQAWCDALANNRVKQDRRSLVLGVPDLEWAFELIEPSQSVLTDESLLNEIQSPEMQSPGMQSPGMQPNMTTLNLRLKFTLPAGSFATMVLREILVAV
ncbi:tRNA pseudouridine(13) synthase TruD [Thiomicrorhabdus sp. Milos-T2]|uniref:tRNA pseudouridine(13) synthase TruD n=1 Tax=Thiomicrorhabdus sp. Milos-T2 TaxID=90814 RepID=UPI0005718903|nr:tRNA pseudouridine(13) synthase TruD [Thiomicrorhabdus sp. Milos-T2]